MQKRIIAATALTAVALIAGATSASAYTLDNTTGKGFVGKGEVQSAFGWKNETMQANQNGITFSIKQDATQALSSTAHQVATQAGTQAASQTGTLVWTQTATQDVTETLSCFKNGAAVQNVRKGVREATRTSTVTDTVYDTRTATRDGDRDGSRSGTRSGSLTGNLVASVDATNKKTGQYTGWFLNGYKAGDPKFVATGAEQFGDASFIGTEWVDTDFGDWDFTGSEFSFPEYDFPAADFPAFDLTGEPTFGPWDTEGTNADPDVCENNGNGITNYKQTIKEDEPVVNEPTSTFSELEPLVDEVVPGAVHAEAPTFGSTHIDATNSTGPAVLLAWFNGASRVLTAAVTLP